MIRAPTARPPMRAVMGVARARRCCDHCAGGVSTRVRMSAYALSLALVALGKGLRSLATHKSLMEARVVEALALHPTARVMDCEFISGSRSSVDGSTALTGLGSMSGEVIRSKGSGGN